MAPATRPDPPVPRRAALLRPRLLDVLGGRFSRRLTVVAAPAGLGKTTLLSQAVRENLLAPQGTDRWLTCRPEHGLLSTVLERVLDRIGGEYGRVERARFDDAAWVGWRLAELLPLPDEQRQGLLQLDDPHERLDHLLAMMP